MVSLAKATLLFEWKRFLPAVFAIAFSGLLVFIQLALLFGMLNTVSFFIDESFADLWIGFPDTKSVDMGRNIPQNIEALIRIDSDVVDVEQVYFGWSEWRCPDGARLFSYLVGIDPSAQGMMLGRLLSASDRRLLIEPDTVLVNKSDLTKLGVVPGDIAEMDGHRVKIAGASKGPRAVGGVNIFASNATCRRIHPDIAVKDVTAYLLAKISDPSRATAVRNRIRPKGRLERFEVWTAKEFAAKSMLFWLVESGAGISLVFSSFLGLLVGLVITSQTLMGVIISLIREYATLRALGVSEKSLKLIVLEQSFWCGIAGLACTGAAGGLLFVLAKIFDVAVFFSCGMSLTIALMIMALALMSGLFAFRTCAAADPATLLR